MDFEVITTMTTISVFSYDCYKDYLNHWHAQKSKDNKYWSLGQFAKLSGLSNTTAISNILKGRKIPAPETVDNIANILKLNQREKMYFEALVEKSRHDESSILKTSLNKILSTLRPNKSHKEITAREVDAISTPYYYVLREIVKLKDFRFDPSWIKQKMSYAVSETEIQKAFDVLIRIGLLKMDEDKITQSVDFYESTTDIPSSAMRSFHKDVLQHTIKAIDEVDVKDRHIISDTIVFSESDLPAIKSMLELFRKEVSTNYDKESGDQVYHFNMQLIPVTKRNP